MPVEVKWADESRTLIIATFTGRWTITEFSQIIDEIRVMLDDVRHDVYAIADGSTSGGLPRGGNMLPHLRRLFTLPIHHLVIIPSSSVTRLVLNLFLQLNPTWDNRFWFVGDVEGAHAALERWKAENMGVRSD